MSDNSPERTAVKLFVVGNDYLREWGIPAKDQWLPCWRFKEKLTFCNALRQVRPEIFGSLLILPIAWRRSPLQGQAGYPSSRAAMYPSMASLMFRDGILFCFALADTAGKTGALGYPLSIFTGIKNDLSHDVISLQVICYRDKYTEIIR